MGELILNSIFDQINTALVSIRDIFLKYKNIVCIKAIYNVSNDYLK